MSNFPKQVERVIRQGYNFRFRYYLNHGFVIVQKALGPFAGFCLIFLLISWIFELVQIQVGTLGIFVGLVFSLVVSPCLMAGFYFVASQIDNDRHFEFSDYFKGFNWASKLAVLSIIETISYSLCLLPLLFLGYININVLVNGAGELFALPFANLLNDNLLIYAGILPLVYLSVAWAFAPLLVIFYDMQVWSAMEASRKIITKKWFLFLLFLVIAGIISMLGIIGLIIGLLITIPAGLCMIYAAFVDIVGLPSDTEEEDILDHLIDEI